MAQAPSEQQIADAQQKTKAEISEKKEDQKRQGKDFIIDKSGHAAGVIPEGVWQSHKEPTND